MPKKHAHPLDILVERTSITIGTLAASTGILGAARVLLQDFVAVSLKGVAAAEAAAIDDGPLMWGICQGNLTLTQLEEAIEADRVIQSDVAGEERSKRPYQILGVMGPSKETDWHEMTRIRLPTFQEDVGFNTFVYNAGDARTTGSLVKIFLQVFGRWL